MRTRFTLILVAGILLSSLVRAQESAPPPPKVDCAKPVQVGGCKCSRPDYPSAAARNGDQGVTTVKVHVSAESKITQVELVRSSGSRLLDRTTVEHFKTACFKAATDASGTPVDSAAIVDYVWRLQ